MDEIYQFSRGVIASFADDIGQVEELGLRLTEAEYEPGVEELFKLVEDWLSLNERIWPGRTIPAVTGAPGLLALRLLLNCTAKAAEVSSFKLIKLLLTSPITTVESTGQTSHQSLIERRDLFWPRATYEYADLGVISIRDGSWENPAIRTMFTTQDEYNSYLAVSLFLVDLGYEIRHQSAAAPLYPGFKLIKGASAGIRRFLSRIADSPARIGALAAVFEQDPFIFERDWPQGSPALMRPSWEVNTTCALTGGLYRQG